MPCHFEARRGQKASRLTADDNSHSIVHPFWTVIKDLADLQGVNIFLGVVYIQQPQRCWEVRSVLVGKAIGLKIEGTSGCPRCNCYQIDIPWPLSCQEKDLNNFVVAWKNIPYEIHICAVHSFDYDCWVIRPSTESQ